MKKLLLIIVILAVGFIALDSFDKDNVATKRVQIENPALLSIDAEANEYKIYIDSAGWKEYVPVTKDVYLAALNGERLELVIETTPLLGRRNIVNVCRIPPASGKIIESEG